MTQDNKYVIIFTMSKTRGQRRRKQHQINKHAVRVDVPTWGTMLKTHRDSSETFARLVDRHGVVHWFTITSTPPRGDEDWCDFYQYWLDFPHTDYWVIPRQ